MKEPSYVSYINGEEISLKLNSSIHKKIVKDLGGKQSFIPPFRWKITYQSKNELANIFRTLQNNNFAFSAGRDWSPSNVFEELRDNEYIEGKFLKIYWTSEGFKTVEN